MNSTPFTVIGVFADSHGDDSFVEWVHAPNVEGAIHATLDIGAGREGTFIIAVLKGHHIDVLNGLGLSSGPVEAV